VALSWHKTLVYFGLAEEHDSEAEREPTPRRRERSRRGAERRPSHHTDDVDDIFGEDEPATRAVLRPVDGGSSRRGGRNGGSVRMHLVIPKSFNDAQQIADRFKDEIPVVLNLQSTETELSKRLIDFASGLTYALDGGMQRVADRVFMLTPRNVEISAEERAQLIEKGFFNQS